MVRQEAEPEKAGQEGRNRKSLRKRGKKPEVTDAEPAESGWNGAAQRRGFSDTQPRTGSAGVTRRSRP